jgi:hypothetical protein
MSLIPHFLLFYFFLLSSALLLPPPSPQLPQAFSLVGYAKAAPGGFGETTGGQGGKVFNVTNDQELQKAIKVIIPSSRSLTIFECSLFEG